MAKENEFIEVLQRSVVDAEPAKGSLEEKRNQLQRAIAELEGNVIKDPRTLENLRKELAKVEKELNKKNLEKSVETGDVTGASIEQTEKEEKIKSDKDVSRKQNEQEQDKNNVEALKQAYYDSIVAYYDARLKSLRHQKEKGELISSDIDYEAEEKFELAMYKARKAYMATGNEDPYEKFRENHDYIDRKAHEPFEREVRQQATRYREIETKIEEIDKEISEINEELDTKDLSESDRAERKSRIEELEAKKVKLDLEKVEYKDIEGITATERTRARKNRQLQALRREAASKGQLKGYDYRRVQRKTAQYNVGLAQKTQEDNIKKRIEEREERIKTLEKQLNETPDSDLETRLNVLEELNKETNMLQADEDQQHNLDRGYKMTGVEMQKETIRAAKIAEETQKEFEEDTREVREALEQRDKVEGELVVAVPSVVGEQDKERKIKMQAAVAAAVIDKPGPEKDNMVDNYLQYKTAECVIKGIENEVRDPNNPEDAKAMLEHEEQLQQADKQLDAVQQSVEQSIN